MTYNDFKIGEDFWVNGKRWRCMDIATAHVLVAEIDARIEADPSWLNGPPYAVGLEVLDAYDWPVCFKTKAEMDAAYND